MESKENPISQMAQISSLPPEIWSIKQFELAPKLDGYDHKLKEYVDSPYIRDNSVTVERAIPIDKTVIDALQGLSSFQVLGLGTLVRVRGNITVMVSLAELANACLNTKLCDMLWILLQIIEETLRGPDDYRVKGGFTIHWKRETSAQSYFDRRRREEQDKRHELARERRVEEYGTSGFDRRKPDHEFEAIIREEVSQISKRLAKVEQQQNETMLQPLNLNKSLTSISPLREEKPQYYDEHSSTSNFLFVKEGQWLFDTRAEFRRVFAFLLDWLAASLGGVSSPSYSTLLWSMDVEVENEAMKSAAKPKDTRQNSCWRDKIQGGKILNLSFNDTVAKVSERNSNHFPADSLILTAAALWALFDNFLERCEGCQCTFRFNGVEYLQCRSRIGSWLVWHYSTEDTSCGGKSCDENVPIALSDNEQGERIYTTSPCILGWFAKPRTHASCDVWDYLGVTANFRSREMVKYTAKEIQMTAQLSVPLIVSPGVGGAVTYGRRNYTVTNSIDQKSELALLRAATKVILIYDEFRDLHLTMDGADIIEMCCIRQLRRVGCDLSPLQVFSHSTALRRMSEWSSIMFTSVTGTAVPGVTILRQVVCHINDLIEQTDAANKDGKLLYWLLEDLLKGIPSTAVKAPKSQDHNSWHMLAQESSPLIFAVGTIKNCHLSVKGRVSVSSKSKNNANSLWNRFQSVPGQNGACGGVVATEKTMKRWFDQAVTERLNLNPMDAAVTFGPDDSDSERTYKVKQQDAQGRTGFGCRCVCKAEEICVHYVQ